MFRQFIFGKWCSGPLSPPPPPIFLDAQVGLILNKCRRLSGALRSFKHCAPYYIMYYTSISRASICFTDSVTWIITVTAHMVICTLLSGKPLRKPRSVTVSMKDTYFISVAWTRSVPFSPHNESCGI